MIVPLIVGPIKWATRKFTVRLGRVVKIRYVSKRPPTTVSPANVTPEN